MPKYLNQASYTAEGTRGLVRDSVEDIDLAARKQVGYSAPGAA